MKCVSLCLALHFFFAGVSFAWSPYPLTTRFLQRIFSTARSTSSQIPQFVLDTRHPWLTANKDWLSHYPNVTEALCSRDSPLWISPTSPDHAPPIDLFKNLSVNGNGIQHDGCQERPAWVNVHHRLQEMASCEAALADVQHLHVDVYVHENLFLSKGGPTLPPPGIPGLFADVLSQMSNLERLDWGMSMEATREFEPAFVEKDLILPSVRYLQPGAGSDYMVSRCPNVEVLEAGDYFHHWSWGYSNKHHSELIKASTGLENLKEWRLSTWGRGWTVGMLQDILHATPNITTLRMDGYLDTPEEILMARRAAKRPYFTELQQETIKEYLRVLALFPNLKNLQLPSSAHLDMGFDGGPWCGNAYDGPEGRAYGRLVAQEGAETTELAAKIAMSALPRLESLEIGYDIANLTLNSLGQPDMTWPWTERMEQYTYEIWEE